MASSYAFATLLTSDAYLPGALTLAAALRDIHPAPATHPEVDFQTVCIVTPETVDVSTVKLLRKAFDVVVGVEIISQRDDKNLQLLGRPDLNHVLTKLHVFRLTQYSKIIFLDADVLPIRPLSHLFTIPHEFSAVPDVGWPDIFNSGVLVLSPGEDKFKELNDLLNTKGTWDGGDQGILNEWRGADWNRLSFAYNTTPTAAYTYAPAYERFGSRISAIHFIGPNKPWSAIGYRPPFASQQPSTSSVSPPAYDYNALVDQWFAVYDRHYRSTTIPPDTHFEVQRYTSAWNEQPGEVGGDGRQSDPNSSAAPMGLDELKRLAVEGLSAAGLSSDRKAGEGDYKSMPLGGRFDLIRREEPNQSQPRPQQVPAHLHSAGAPIDQPLPTPGPNEIPPSPHPQPIPLPPSQTSFSSHEDAYAPKETRKDTAQHEPLHDQQPQSLPSQSESQPQHHEPPQSWQQHHHQPQPQSHWHQPSQSEHQQHEHHPVGRPSSPPKLEWNPAIEPPPNTAPPSSAFPADTYFPNVWDQPPSKQHDQAFQQRAESPTRDSGTFFRPPPTPEIPETLLRQGHYRGVTGEGETGHSPSPDRNKIKSVFPWEERPRHMPERRFPATDAPQPELFMSPGSQTSSSSPPLERYELPSRRSSISPSHGLPRTLTYANAWDNVPSIQKYASRLVKPSLPPPPLASAFDSEEWKKRSGRSWDERTEASSRDGDDEEESDEEEVSPVRRRWTEDSDDDAKTTSSRSRSGSISASYIIKGKKKEYRVRGVQTISPEMRSQGVQVDIGIPKVLTPSQDQDRNRRSSITSSRGSMGGRKPTGGSTALPSIISGAPDLPMSTAASSPVLRGQIKSLPPSTPPSIRSPREFTFPEPPGTARPAPKAPPVATPPTPTLVRSSTPLEQQQSPSIVGRQFSNDGSITSPPSSIGPLSPESYTASPPPRKAARVFDPARGVEVFKRGSEEVLARFLKMSSWEDENSQRV